MASGRPVAASSPYFSSAEAEGEVKDLVQVRVCRDAVAEHAKNSLSCMNETKWPPTFLFF